MGEGGGMGDLVCVLNAFSQAPVCDYLLEMMVQVLGVTSYELIDDTNTVVFSGSPVPGTMIAKEAECLIEGIKYTYKITDTDVNAGYYTLMLNDKLLASGGEFDNYEKVTFRVGMSVSDFK